MIRSHGTTRQTVSTPGLSTTGGESSTADADSGGLLLRRRLHLLVLAAGLRHAAEVGEVARPAARELRLCILVADLTQF